MPEWLDRLYNARAINNDLPAQARNEELQRMYRAYGEIVNSIVADRDTGQMNADRAARLLSSIRDQLDRIRDTIPQALQSQLEDLGGRIANEHVDAIRAAVQRAGADISVATSFDDVPQEVLSNIMRRRGLGLSDSYRSLIGFWHQGSTQDVDRYLTQAIGRGIPVGRAKRELAAVIVRGDERIRPYLSREARGTLPDVDLGPVDTPERTRQLLVNTRRIIVSEVNTTNDEAHRLSGERSPVVRYLKWEVSGRHYGLNSSPDECTIYHEEDLYGYGPGLYRPENKPALPHPNCACRVSFVTRPPNEWNEPLPEPNAPQVSYDANTVQDLINSRGGSIGTQGAGSMAERINANNRMAHRMYVEI